ncbi:ABC transporter ATP-binding protein [Desulfovibrio sp. 86]|uniref:Putative ABC transporter ATP-binding protein DVU_1056 n=1 Tax=uncultured Desulfovibrio sp. TaxID=167968 RepID=A0A212L030_9BACT|nr:ABC transporter ATP-binding protein [Desulfovibrio sp. 86]SCM70856.1 putative ABC transporter ATP-binding protein DVU_1056 [uncultured Desulfovibrio sp.]VZH32552.1 putative ABC transporter ATP-binding protein DVU_1056 [Desulfovibrio sp. 86]
MDCNTEKDCIFSLENIHFQYERDGNIRQVLKGVDLALLPDQHIGFYGPNGSGKTTLFRCVTGLITPQQGCVRFHGREMRTEKDFHSLRCAVGFVLQHAEDQLFFPSVLEDVAFGPLNLGLSPEAARERAHETLRNLGLDGFENRLTHRLSGGEKKLVSLAAVLAMRPEALLLDEPTNGLDNEARERIIDILQKLPTARITISHDWDFLARISTTYLTLAHGRLDACAPSFSHTHAHAHPLGDEPHAH